MQTLRVQVCLSPDLVHLHTYQESNIVVADIMRATSCMVAGLGSGVARIRPVETVEEADAWKEKGYYTAGERNGEKIEHFDLGNSPFSFMENQYKGQSIVMTTTNGTRAIHKTAAGHQVAIGAFLNLGAVGDWVLAGKRDVMIVCAGWKGRLSLEDTLFAGALTMRLTQYGYTLQDDEALSALTLFQAARADLLNFYQRSSHAQRLKRLGVVEDIPYCLEMNRFDIVPLFNGEELTLA